MTLAIDRSAATDAPILDVLAERFSTRGSNCACGESQPQESAGVSSRMTPGTPTRSG